MPSRFGGSGDGDDSLGFSKPCWMGCLKHDACDICRKAALAVVFVGAHDARSAFSVHDGARARCKRRASVSCSRKHGPIAFRALRPSKGSSAGRAGAPPVKIGEVSAACIAKDFSGCVAYCAAGGPKDFGYCLGCCVAVQQGFVCEGLHERTLPPPCCARNVAMSLPSDADSLATPYVSNEKLTRVQRGFIAVSK